MRSAGNRWAIACVLAVASSALVVSAPGCGSNRAAATLPAPDAGNSKTLTTAELQDPGACSGCHAQHYAQWSSSMHAYASVDPLFVAMNARAQRETGGAIGAFCTQCHAPMAVRLGDGGVSAPAALAAAQSGVTCYFCHSVAAVNGADDAPLALASDGVLRGPIADPVTNVAHASAYSALHDQAQPPAASLCGACHDVTTTGGVPVERTFAEWKTSLYAQDTVQTLQTCSACHMPGSQGTAANAPNVVPTRTVHDHSVPGVDLARPLAPLPGEDAQAALVQASLDTAIGAQLCVAKAPVGVTVTVTLDNGFVGHDWPSGAVHDRRAWVELVASLAGGTVFSSGVVPNDQTSVESLGDPNLWLFKETLQDANDASVLFMWQAASASPAQLPVVTTAQALGATGPNNAVSKTYAIDAVVDDVTMQVRLLPVAIEVIQSLIASGDLDPSYLTGVRAFTLSGSQLEWNLGNDGYGCVP